MKQSTTQQSYENACEQFNEFGIDVKQVLDTLATVPISLHCWQGDDVTGFEKAGDMAKGGIMATGNYPGRARNGNELREDLEKALTLIPGSHRVNIHALYAETNGRKVERNELAPEHFSAWVDWAKNKKIALDFNPSYFAHPRADQGFTLAHSDTGIRRFWVEHGIACRTIAEHFGKVLGSTCITNFWVPDGYKDIPADRKAPRERLKQSLDEIFAVPINQEFNKDAVESKLFGIGSESYVVGSHEFYMGYALGAKKMLCLDMGHFHPTEMIADKISSILMFSPELLLHVSRGIRWDSDHIVVLNDELKALAQEIIRGGYLARVHIALDYFDASVNRLAAWVIGMRATQKALLIAMLEPYSKIAGFEKAGDHTARLAWTETAKILPYGAVWDHFCLSKSVPMDSQWLDIAKTYEREVLRNR